tara:strand:- start:446 stop:808 length:363 start_codon:yes stop_codon:yes gene_type:complete
MYNRFTKIQGKQTAYLLDNWQTPIFGERIYLLPPRYITGRKQPDFSLVFRGKHISGFYQIGESPVFSGDYKGNLLIGLSSSDFERFELITTSIPTIIGRSQLETGKLNHTIEQARKAVTI